MITSSFEFHGFDRHGEQVSAVIKETVRPEDITQAFINAVRKFFKAYPNGRIYSYFDANRNQTVIVPQTIQD